MKDYRWDPAKSEWLKRTRGVSFEEIVQAPLLGIEQHPKRTNQRILIFAHQEYVWAVPCVEETDYYFLKTLHPSRKHKERYRDTQESI